MAFNKTKGIFDKLWRETFEDKPWLQMILQNTILAFIENPGLTLIEFPIFFRNPDFRKYIVENIHYNWQVRDYWNLTFAGKSKRLQEEQLVAAETRTHNMLNTPYVSDILGQSKSTLDFEKLIAERKIILVNLSAQLSYEARKIIGTILISELLHAIEQRPVDKRDQFSIYVDEFHNFAAYQDFSTLITDAPKFGVATTLAHHERYGQLAGHPRMMGATAAIANMVLFQVTGKDAQELARDLADAPTTETRYEDIYIISQNPVNDLLNWHPNPEIRSFADKYIRPMRERLQDIGGDIEHEKLIRGEYLDISSMYRIEAQMEAADRQTRDSEVVKAALSSAGMALRGAMGQTVKLKTLSQEIGTLKVTLRELNRFLAGVMEKRIFPGQEEFSNFLIKRMCNVTVISDEQKELLSLYIALTYGDPNTARKIPYLVAKKCIAVSSATRLGNFSLTSITESLLTRHSFSDEVKFVEDDVKRRFELRREEYKKGCEKGYAREIYFCEESVKDLRRWFRNDKKALAQFLPSAIKYVEEKIARQDEVIRGEMVEFERKYGGENLLKTIPPLDLPLRVLNWSEIRDVKTVCMSSFATTSKQALEIIQRFVEFCGLLSKPENHIVVRSGQSVAKQVNI